METRYHETYAEWQSDPAAFWANAAEGIDWFTPPDKTFDPDAGLFGRWFSGATCNTCYNCVDRHVAAGHGERIALRYDSPVTGQKRSYTFSEVQAEVSALASVMRATGLEKGDRVVIYMPMVPEAIFAMLASARLGAIHSVVFGGFAARELAVRLDDAKPRLVISASCGVETTRIVEYKPLLDAAIEMASAKPQTCIILQRDIHPCELVAGRDLEYLPLVEAAKAEGRGTECVPVASTDPLYILYTSGTTGQPKGVVRDNGGHMVALKWSMANHYGVKPGETFWAASDIGWVVGHSYICYGPLLHGCATVVYEGKPVGTPDAGAFWRVIQDNEVTALFAAPTAFRAIRKEDPDGELISTYDLSRFRTLFLAGERSDSATVLWAQEKLDRPVVDHWWQTETGWPMSGNPVGLGLLEVKLGSAGVPMPGYDIRVLDDDGNPVSAGTLGNIVCKLPLPPSSFPTLWNAEDRYRNTYFKAFAGYYATADAGFLDEDGYVFIMARTDDVINVAGHRLSTGAMEEVIGTHPAVAECAVVGAADATKGQTPVGFVVLKNGSGMDAEQLRREVVALVREQIGPVAAFRVVIEVARLPKTRSGKVLRGVMQKIVDGSAWSMPAAVEDPGVFAEIASAAAVHGFGAGDVDG